MGDSDLFLNPFPCADASCLFLSFYGKLVSAPLYSCSLTISPSLVIKDYGIDNIDELAPLASSLTHPSHHHSRCSMFDVFVT